MQATFVNPRLSQRFMSGMDQPRSPDPAMRSREDDLLAPRFAIVLLPVVFLAHLAEEWFGGFLAWTPRVLGYEIGLTRFVMINAIGFAIFAAGTLLSMRVGRFSWMAVSIAALLGLNGVLHFLATIGFATYSPGVVTGLVFYLPLSTIVLRSASKRMPRPGFSKAVLIGVVAHAFVTIAALG